MTEQIEMLCSTCRWWDQTNTFTTTKGHLLASCQAKPPRVVEKNDKIHTVWPTTREDQRCGGWRGVPAE
jgi:hypothetical protein